MARLNFTFLGVLILILYGKDLLAQGTYRSRKGTVSITTTYSNNLITAHSKQVEIDLNFETSSIKLTLAPKDMHVGVDSLDKQLQQRNTPFILKGMLTPPGITTTQHLPKILQLNGILEISQNLKIEIKGVARLEHVNGGEDLACQLALYFDTDLRSLGIQQIPGSLENMRPVKIQFFETVLRKTD